MENKKNDDVVIDEIELMNHRAMVELPENAVEVQLRIKVFHEGELITVGRTLSMDDIRTAFRKADEGYIDDDDEFVITEKGLQWLEDHRDEE